ncbi:MAG: hypothetical protein RL497_1526, partial [Pseudomonadota bacterium]
MNKLPTNATPFNPIPHPRLSLALCIALASQGAWSANCPAQPNCNVNINGFNGSLSGTQNLCITGTYTRAINNLPSGAVIYVAPGANFTPSSFSNPAGKLINCGTASLPSLTLSAGFNFSNYGTAEFKSNINWNGKASFFNDADAKINFKTSFSLKNNSSLTNDGEIISTGVFESDNGTSITNTGYIRLSGGNFNPNGVVINSGFVQTDEFININTNAELTNNCSFISQKGFNNNSGKTRNNGYIFVTGTAQGNDLVQNNQPFSQGPNAVVVGTRFFNNAGNITGGGKYYFTGDTRNQGNFGNDGGGINFYDTTRSPGKIFDVQSPAPHTSVTANAFTPPKVDAVVPSCSKNVAPVKPVISINIVAGDDIINALEDDSEVAISGNTTDAPNGSLISLDINGKTYSTTVNNNNWNLLLPAADAQILDASEIISAQVSLADNSAISEKTTRTITHTTELPRITIDVVAGDDIINTTEDDTFITIQGTTTGAENGSTASVFINNKKYTASVNNNTWKFNLPAADAQALHENEIISATVINAVGNVSRPATRPIKHTENTPTININVIAGDDIINLNEDNTEVELSGTTTWVENGQVVTLSIKGKNYRAGVNNNAWSTFIPAQDAQALGAREQVDAQVNNVAGDTAQTSRTVNHSINSPTVTINVVAGDDIINAAEDDAPVVVSGKTTLIEDGQKVVLIVNGKNYEAAVNNNTWTTEIPAAAAQALKASEKITATTSNKAGDKAETDRTITHSINSPTVSINVIAGDDIINAAEDDAPVTISGKTTWVEDGAKVTVNVNGKNYEATVNNKAWTLAIPAEDVQTLDAQEKITATVTNKAGDKAEGDRTITHSINSPTVIINVVAGDDIINATEDDAPVIISGKTTLVEDGAKVTVSVNGKTYEAVVNTNAWSVSMPATDAQGLGTSEKITAAVTNKAGDKAETDRAITHSVNSPTVTINVIAGDDIINTTEDDAPVIVSGKTTLIEDGQKAVLIINGKNYETAVNNNTWTTEILAVEAQALKASEKITAAITNKAGDKAEGDRTITHSINSPTVSINIIAGDDIINATEDDAPVIVSGKTTLIEDGQKVVLIINGKNYETAVNNNTWTTEIPAVDAQTLKASEKITATASNKAGDKAEGDRTITHSINSPTVSINVVAGDDIINATEDDAPVIISGKTTWVEDGAKITVSVNGKIYEAVVNANTWSASMPATDAQGLGTSEKITAAVTNKAGDKAEGDRIITHSINSPTVSINVIAGDDIINAAEDDAPVIISGKTTLVEDGAKITVTVNGKTYAAVVNASAWSVSMPATDAQALGNSEKITATVTNKAGDTAKIDRTVIHSGREPTVTINVIAGDDIINTTEDDAPVIVSGKTTLIEDSQKVVLIINGKNYEAVVNNNTWIIEIPAVDAQALKVSEKITATASNRAGDKAEGDRTITHSINSPTVSINIIAGDDIINATEDDAPVIVSGKTTL